MALDARHTKTERETKLRPPEAFDLSALSAVLPEMTVRPREAHRLSATYFDTHDLTLARAGITIRHRMGDGPPTWTVKLPGSELSDALVRLELDIVGERNRRPSELAALVTAHLRGRRLVPVAQIETSRARAVLEDEVGQPLVEIAVDDVVATRGRRQLGAWREIEVEALDDAAGDTARRRAVRALRKAGCKAVRPQPKLVRSLGAEAAAPPEVVVPSLGKHPSAAEVVHAALSRSVRQMLDRDPRVRVGGDAEDLHQLRVATRRLRSDLRTFRDVLDEERTAGLRDELRWVADSTNRLRDLDVLRIWLVAHAGALPEVDRPGLDELVRRCDEEIAEQRAGVLQMMASERYVELVHRLVAMVGAQPSVDPKQEKRARRRLARQVRRRWDRLEAQVQALGDHPTDEGLHQARITAKRCRAAVQAIEPLTGRSARRLARSLGRLQDLLGAVHDASVMEGWLRSVPGPSEAFVAGELAAMVRAEGRAHAARWPRAWKKAQRRR
jgi:CHAD domain-containing protein